MNTDSEYPGLIVNSNTSFCFDAMECFDFSAGSVRSSLLKRIFKTIQFLHLNVVVEIINAAICCFTHFLLVFSMSIFDGRRYKGSFNRYVTLGERGASGFCYEALWKLWGGEGVSSDTVM